VKARALWWEVHVFGKYPHVSWLFRIGFVLQFVAFYNMARGRANGGKGRKQRKGGGKQSTTALAGIQDVAPMFKVPRNLDHRFVRTWDYGAILAGATDGGYGFAFTFDSFPGYTDFTTLYDSYRIDRVETTWELIPTALTTVKTSAIMPIVLAWPDYDDATAPASLATSSQVSQMERLNLTEAKPSVRRSLVPRISASVGQVSFSAGLAMNMQNAWIDMATTNVAHYGIKFWIRNFNTTTITETGATVAVSFRMFCTCRNPR